MRQFLALTLFILYSFTSSGATIYLHQCSGTTIISLMEGTNTHENCPMCSKDHDHTAKKKNNCQESHSCKDIQVKLDQLSDKLFSKDYAESFFGFGPAIITLYWMQPNLFIDFAVNSKYVFKERVAYPHSSPPTYLLNRNFRI